MGYLNEVLSNIPIDAIMCRRFIELRPYGITTQSVLASMFETGQEDEADTEAQRSAAPAPYGHIHPEGGARALFVIPEEGGLNKDQAPPVLGSENTTATAVPQRSEATQDVDQAHKLADAHKQPDELEPYDFVFSVVDSTLDSYFLFNDPDSSTILKQRLTADATEVYCMVDKDPGNCAPYYCRDWEEALQIVRAMGIASRKLAQ
jgi:hypothetical protein